MGLYNNYFMHFLMGSIFGYVVENIWSFIKNRCVKHRPFEERKGLIYGPFVPIYGVGALFMAIFIDLLKIQNTFYIMILGLVINIFVEYIASYLQEKIFHSKSWDYSDFPLNINGRVNLIYSVLFSIATIFWYLTLYKFDNYIVAKIPIIYMNTFSMIMTIFLLIDILLSSYAVEKLSKNKELNRNNKFLKYIDKVTNADKTKKTYSNMRFL